MKKIVCFIITLITIIVFSTTAFAADLVDDAYWDSSVCLYGFTATGSVDKDTSETWQYVDVWVEQLSFASTPVNDYLWATPRSSGGLDMGDPIQCKLYDTETVNITKNKYNNSIKLRIDNPNSGNNMKSFGWWFGYIQ